MADVKTLNTRLQVLNDTAEALATKSTAVPLKGEIIYDQTNRKMKIGDGATALGDLKFVGGDEAQNFNATATAEQTDEAAITAAIGSTEIHKGDTAIVKRLITGDKYSYTAYVYNGTAWTAMDGNYNAKNVYFDADLTLTEIFGRYKPDSSGSINVPSTGQSVYGLIDDAFSQEKNPSATQPSASVKITSGSGTFEIGTKKNLTYSASLNTGKYSYGPTPTGVSATSYTATCEGKILTGATGTFEDIVADGDKWIDISIAYSDGSIPTTNKGKAYEAAQIKAGSKTATSKEVLKGVRYMFWGPMTDAGMALNSANIRALAHNQATTTGALATFGAGAGAKKVVVAVPSNRKITKVLMPSALNADVTALFVKQSTTVPVNGAEGYAAAAYNIYVYQPASIDAGETYTVTIG